MESKRGFRGFKGPVGAKACHIWQDKESGAWNFSFRPLYKWTVNDLVTVLRIGTKELIKLQTKQRQKATDEIEEETPLEEEEAEILDNDFEVE